MDLGCSSSSREGIIGKHIHIHDTLERVAEERVVKELDKLTGKDPKPAPKDDK